MVQKKLISKDVYAIFCKYGLIFLVDVESGCLLKFPDDFIVE